MHRSSLDFKLVQRVCLLQQALDQALASLEELRGQIEDKDWIEAQLATTEKYANVQQQAIVQLKQHLSQFTEVQQHLLDVIAYRLNELIDHQQVEFNRLRMKIQQSETELQTYLQYLGSHCTSDHASATSPEAYSLGLETEVMVARVMAVSLSRQLNLARQNLSSLTTEIDDHHLSLNQIITTIQSMMANLAALETTPEYQLQPIALATNTAVTLHEHPEESSMLQGTLRRQELHIHELEKALMEQFKQQTQLKQRCQVLATERDFYKRQLETMQKGSQNNAILSTEQEHDDEAQYAAPTHFLPLPRLRSQPPSPIQPLKLWEEDEFKEFE